MGAMPYIVYIDPDTAFGEEVLMYAESAQLVTCDTSNYGKLFSTPEMAARTMVDRYLACNAYGCSCCPLEHCCPEDGDYDALLEWLNSDEQAIKRKRDGLKMAKRSQLITRWNDRTCDMCGKPITLALCHDVRMYDRRLKDDYSGTTVTTLHYRLCDECSEKVEGMLVDMIKRYNR